MTKKQQEHVATARNNAMNDKSNALDDQRITDIKPLLTPAILLDELPLTQEAFKTIDMSRREVERIVQGQDDRMLVVVGPCSIHDPVAALDYACRLKSYADQSRSDLKIVMRVYFEKPRTTVGWKGLINDPFLDGSFKINNGLRMARELLLEINNMGLPCGCEFLDTISPQYIGDLVTWGAIGARTTESQIHRELASGLSVPVGFKNGTDGNVQIAIDAIKAAREAHHFLSVTKQGVSAIVCTAGNPFCHIILRGGVQGPNYSREYVVPVSEKLKKAGLQNRIMIDCSHGNSEKQHRRQHNVCQDISEQLEDAQSGSSSVICGVMIESHLVEGRQNISDCTGPCGQGLVYGQSITDACLGWDETVVVLERLRQAVRARRSFHEESVVDSF